MDDLDNLEKKIKAFQDDKADKDQPDNLAKNQQIGMRAGSEFMAYIISGGLAGFAIGHFFGNLPLWLIIMIFLGFGLGIYRASQLLK